MILKKNNNRQKRLMTILILNHTTKKNMGINKQIKKLYRIKRRYKIMQQTQLH